MAGLPMCAAVQNLSTSQRAIAFTVLFIVCWIVIYQSSIKFSDTSPVHNLKTNGSHLYFRLMQPEDKFKLLSEGSWANFAMSRYIFYAYSAFYDDRDSLQGDPVIRIIAISVTYEYYLKWTNRQTAPLYCSVHYKDKTVYFPAVQPPQGTGPDWWLFGVNYKGYVYTCPTDSNRTDGAKPLAVRIVSQPGDESVATCVPVEMPEKPAKKRDVAVCVQCAYGNQLNQYRLVEWIESQRLLGVDHIGLYNLTDTAQLNPIFDYYKKAGLVNLRNSAYIWKGGFGAMEYGLHWVIAINDCFYRNMNRFHYIAVMDFDEVIAPRNYSTLPELLRFLNATAAARNNTPASYRFYNQYYFLDLPPDSNLSPQLSISRFRHRLPHSAYDYACKSILDPRYCVGAFNHHCCEYTPGAPPLRYMVVDDRLGANQHYKKCHFDKATCRAMLKTNITIDEDMLRFTEEIRKRTVDKVFDIYGARI